VNTRNEETKVELIRDDCMKLLFLSIQTKCFSQNKNTWSHVILHKRNIIEVNEKTAHRFAMHCDSGSNSFLLMERIHFTLYDL
jgi:hypothetical protein